MVLLLPVKKICWRHWIAALLKDNYKSIVILVWKRPEQNSIDNTKDGGVRTDAQSKGDDRHRCKTMRLAELAQRVAKILEYLLHDLRHLNCLRLTRTSKLSWDRLKRPATQGRCKRLRTRSPEREPRPTALADRVEY